MNPSYYALKRYLGGTKWTAREKLCFHWYPTPGCNMHKEIIGERRGEILFERYCFKSSRNYSRHNEANLLYWRSHPAEWAEIQRRTDRKE